MLAPESPYPLQGGGAYRTASLLHYFARFATVDLIQFSETGEPALLPEGLVRRQHVIRLPRHSKSRAARYLRNGRRAILGIPPLIDRLAGFGPELEKLLGSEHYHVGIVEHFWCAPYLNQMRRACTHTILDLHNVESILDRRCAVWTKGAVRAGHRRFAEAYRSLEASLLPGYSLVLATSESDADVVRSIATTASVAVYPNALPLSGMEALTEQNRLVFSANFEYHPNVDAVHYLLREIWPGVRDDNPGLELWLVGRGEGSIRTLADSVPGVHLTGPIENAQREIQQARIVLAPLRIGSGTRIKILEGWAAGRAVIATPLAAEGLEAIDGKNILLAYTAQAFRLFINQLLGDEPLRRELGKEGRKVFETTYSWDSVWHQLDFALVKFGAVGPDGYTGSDLNAIRR